MSLAYSWTRPGGSPLRYSGTQRQAARVLASTGAPATLSQAALAAMTSATGIRVVCDVLVEIESNRLGRATAVELLIGGSVVAAAEGDVTSLVDGRRAATTAVPAVRFPAAPAGTRAVRERWTVARDVNVVEVYGATGAQITQVRVSTLDAVGSATVRGTFSSTQGKIAAQVAPYDAPITCYGILVEILDGVGGFTGAGYVVEVDPMLIRDVSGDAASVVVEFAREDDPAASASPVGVYAASTVVVELDDTAGQWNPATNASIDVGHRIEVAFGVVRPDGLEELVPGGVFYSDPFDTDSDSTTVTIHGIDRLGRNSDVTLNETVTVNANVGDLLRRLARTYLDLDDNQVVIDATTGASVIPYAYPSGPAGSYFADLANALGATMHIDPYDRLVFSRRTDSTGEVVASVTDQTALQAFRRPAGYDVTTSAVLVNASPLTLSAEDELWAMPSGGISIPAAGSYTVIAPYSSPPALNAYLTGLVADGSYTTTAAAFYADRAEITIRNNEARTLIVADLRVRGNPLVETPLSARAEHAPSVRRYGSRQLEVTARLVQTQGQLDALAASLLDAFRALDDNGNRRIPELTIDALGFLHFAAGDRLLVAHTTKGFAGEYVLLSRKLTYAGSALLVNDARVRQVPGYDVLTLDSGELLDDGHLVGF